MRTKIPKLTKMEYGEMSLFKTPRPEKGPIFCIPLPSEIRKQQTRYHKNLEFSRHNKQLLSIEISGTRGRADTLTASGAAKKDKSSLNLNKSMNLDDSKISQSPAKVAPKRTLISKKTISFISDEKLKPVKKNDSFIKANTHMFSARHKLQEMAKQADKINYENARSMNCFNYICRAQIKRQENRRVAKEQIFQQGIMRKKTMHMKNKSLEHRNLSCSSNQSIDIDDSKEEKISDMTPSNSIFKSFNNNRK